MPLQSRPITVPDGFTFWDPNPTRLTIINPEDFPEREIIETLEIDATRLGGFGNCDPEEAQSRSEMLEYLNGHPELMEIVQKLRSQTNIPRGESAFQTFYDPTQKRNPFWAGVYELLEHVESQIVLDKKIPKRLRVFYDVIKNSAALEEDEQTMARVIGELLETTAVFEGIARVSVKVVDASLYYPYIMVDFPNQTSLNIPPPIDQDLKKGETPKERTICVMSKISFPSFYGHRTFSFALSELRQRTFPRWTEWRWFPLNWLGLGRLRQNHIEKQNQARRKQAYEAMVLTESPEVAADVATAINEKIANFIRNGSSDDERFLFNDTELLVHFAYGRQNEGNQNTLVINIMDLESIWGVSLPNMARVYEILGFHHSSFSGYDPKRMKMIRRGQEMADEALIRQRTTLARRQRFEEIVKCSPEFFGKSFTADCPRTNDVHRWRALENFYESGEFQATYAAMSRLRNFIANNLVTIVKMSKLLETFKNRAKELGAPLCFPEIVNGENVIEFDDLYPLHLGSALEGKKVVPINGLPSINGNFIGLTGRHGGGKTVTEHTITGNTWIALSGCPIFGRRFRISGKTHLGMVFIEGVSGKSVCQLLVEKMTRVFEGINNVPGKGVLLVLDELGSATQEKDGMRLALKVLKALHEKQVSLVFSTQIVDVAEEASSRFGARCFSVDKEHRLRPGIAGGELDELTREAGLAKFLK